MAWIRKIICALCLAGALAVLLGAWYAENPLRQPDRYASVHPAATMLPLMGFSADHLVNTGDAKALDALPGVGEVISARMVETREALGGYRLPEDLMLVKGIGEKTLEKIMDYLDGELIPLPELDE